jgi:alpha-tubulin suppressor-like RCC1 family protein
MGLAALLFAATPSAVVPQEFSALSAGERFTCGLSSDGAVYCWGADGLGQLGIGAAVGRCDRSIYARGPCARAPVAVAFPPGRRFTSISAGSDHACAIDAAGDAYCWGDNHFGQLGVTVPGRCRTEPSRREEALPPLACTRQPVRVPLSAPVRSIATGEHVTCAVLASGETWCWGVYGRVPTPTRVRLDQPLASVAAGGEYVCGLTRSGGLRCWSWPEDVERGASAPSATLGWTSLTVGTRHACALDAAGRAHCWGSDADAALGIGRNAHNKYDEVPVTPVLGDHRFHSIATGAVRTCAIDGDGALHCWGRVPEGAADDRCLDSNRIAGTNDCTTRPVLVHPRMQFRAVTVGASHQCGLSTAGAALCWGANEAGQLGDGTLTSRNDLAVVRSGGVSRSQARLLDTRERVTWVLAHGGIALLVLIAALFVARDRMGSLRPVELAALWTAALIATALVDVAQPLVFMLGVTAYRAGVALRAWWRAGGAAPVSSRAGLGAIVTVLAGWLLVGGALVSVGASPPQGEVGAGLAMLAILQSGGVALVLSAIAAVVAGITLRNNRGAKPARVALTLASLTLVAGAVVALMLFWPTER